MLLLLLLLSHFSRVRLCATPYTAAHQAPPSLGFSRQEPWSGLPLPSPMHESEKWKWSCSVVSDSFQPHGLQPTRLLHPRDSPGKSTGVGCHCLLHTLLLLSIGAWHIIGMITCWIHEQSPLCSFLPRDSSQNPTTPCVSQLCLSLLPFVFITSITLFFSCCLRGLISGFL